MSSPITEAQRSSSRWIRPSAHAALIAAVAAIATAGCEATIRPREPLVLTYEDEGVLVRAPVVPPDIWTYPRALFGGTYVYYVDGLWYYPTGGGWMVFRREPIELSRERRRIERAR